jgi:hypothetical protein
MIKTDRSPYKFSLYLEDETKNHKYYFVKNKVKSGFECLKLWNNYKRKYNLPNTIKGIKYINLKFKKEPVTLK